MATAGVSPEGLELLQQYAIDVKDFAKANARYKTVILSELVPQKGEAENAEVIAATKQAQDRLKEVWEEYLASTQAYFNRLAKGLVGDLVASSDAMTAAAIEKQTIKAESPLADSIAGANATNASPIAPPAPTDNANVPTTVVPATTVAPSAVPSVPPSVPPSAPPSPLRAGAAPVSNLSSSMSFTAAASPAIPAPGRSSSTVISSSLSGPVTTLTLQQQAERMSDLCSLCDKWYVRHEAFFQLPNPEGIARVASRAVASVSRLVRLLGLRVACVCAGSSQFLRAFIETPDTPQWVGQCGDREMMGEVEGFLNLVERMSSLVDEDSKAYPRVPFGWLYRVGAFFDPHDPMPSIPPKRRSQAIRVALQLLRVSPAQATAAGIHSTLLRVCLAKGGASQDEVDSVVKLMLELFDDPKSRQYIKISDISIIFAPFLETTATTTPVAAQEYLATINLAKDLIVSFFSTWVGSLWISCETTSLRSLIDVLHLPGDFDRKMVIFTLFNKLLVRLAPHRGMALMEVWGGSEEEKRKRAAAAAAEMTTPAESVVSATVPNGSVTYDGYFTTMNVTDSLDAEADADFIPTTKALGYHVMDPLLGRVLIALTFHGLPMALMDMLQNIRKNRVGMSYASKLMQDMFVLMDTVLPKATVRSLHEAFNTAVGRLAWGGDIFVGGLTSQLFHSYKANKGAPSNTLPENLPGGTGSPMMAIAANTTQMPNSTFGTLEMDDPTFLSMLKESQVEQSPTDFHAWKYDLLLVLVQGPLRVLRRMRAAKEVLKTLIAFYIPRDTRKVFFMRTFSSLKVDEASSSMCVLGIEMVNLLLSTREGTALLNDADFTDGVAMMLKEVRAGKPRILTKERVNSRVGQALLRMTGQLSTYANGLVLMREYNIFSIIDELFSRLQGTRVAAPAPDDTLQDVCYQLLQYLYLGAVPNYGVCDDIRHTFIEALRSSSNAIRLCAAMQLKKAVWRDLSTSMKWGIETLVRVLHDDFYNVVESAFKLLLSICLSSNEGLDFLISLFPTVLMESEMILQHAKELHLDVLLYRIAGRPSGFRFLQSYGWVEQELHRWETFESLNYVGQIERLQSGDVSLDNASGDFASFNRSRHTRTYSESFSSIYKMGTSPTSPSTNYVPLLTADTAVSANFFPLHFAAVLCKSPEGCAVFKHSELWNRSVKCILSQPLPPDIVYDDSLSDESECSEEMDDDDMNMAGEGTHMVPVKPATLSQPHGDGYGGGGGGGVGASSMSRGADNSYIQSSLAARRNTAGSFNMQSALATSVSTSVTAANAQSVLAQINALAGSAAPNGRTSTAPANDSGVYEPHLSVSEMHKLQKGKLSTSNAVLLSAARGYKAMGRAFSMECVGDSRDLKDAIMVVCQVGSSDAGYGLFCTVPELEKRLVAICRFAAIMSVRCVGLQGVAILARRKGSQAQMKRAGYMVVNNPNAYVSEDGIPYAVAFAHMKATKSMSIARKNVATNTAARHAYADFSGDLQTANIPRKICDNVLALANPVSREASKAVLYKIMKRHPNVFVEEYARRLCLNVGSTYRMRHAERKFLAELLENAQITAAAPSAPRHSHVG